MIDVQGFEMLNFTPHRGEEVEEVKQVQKFKKHLLEEKYFHLVMSGFRPMRLISPLWPDDWIGFFIHSVDSC